MKFPTVRVLTFPSSIITQAFTVIASHATGNLIRYLSFAPQTALAGFSPITLNEKHQFSRCSFIRAQIWCMIFLTSVGTEQYEFKRYGGFSHQPQKQLCS